MFSTTVAWMCTLISRVHNDYWTLQNTPQRLAELLLEKSSLVARESNRLPSPVTSFPTPPLSASPEPSRAQSNEPNIPNFQTPDTPPQEESTSSFAVPEPEVPTSSGTTLNSPPTSLQQIASPETAADLPTQSDQETPLVGTTPPDSPVSFVETKLDSPVSSVRAPLDPPAPSEQVDCH